MLHVSDLSFRHGERVLFDRASVAFSDGWKVGLVGRNGAGKSTLFALFNGTLHEDGGDFSMPKSWRMAQVAQNMPETQESATDFVVQGDTRLAELREVLQKAEAGGDGMEIAHAYTDLADAGEYDAVPRAQALILGLGFGAMAFASNAGPANLGFYGSMAILIGLLNDLFFLPALIIAFDLKFRGDPADAASRTEAGLSTGSAEA